MRDAENTDLSDQWCREFEVEYRKRFGEERLKSIEEILEYPDAAPSKLTDGELLFLLSNPVAYADLKLLYLLDNDIYKEEYYLKAIYLGSNPYDFPMERAVEYVKEYYDEGKDILDNVMIKSGFLHLDLTPIYLEDKEYKEKFKDRLVTLLNSEQESLLFYGVVFATYYEDDKEVLERILELANEIIARKKDYLISKEIVSEFIYSLKVLLGMESEL